MNVDFQAKKRLAGAAQLLTKREAASLLACSIRTIERLIASGVLVKIKVLGAVRLRLSDVEKITAGGSI